MAVSLGVQPGDKILNGNQCEPIHALVRMPSQRNFEVAGIYDTGSDVDQQLVYTTISDAGRLLHLQTRSNDWLALIPLMIRSLDS